MLYRNIRFSEDLQFFQKFLFYLLDAQGFSYNTNVQKGSYHSIVNYHNNIPFGWLSMVWMFRFFEKLLHSLSKNSVTLLTTWVYSLFIKKALEIKVKKLKVLETCTKLKFVVLISVKRQK